MHSRSSFSSPCVSFAGLKTMFLFGLLFMFLPAIVKAQVPTTAAAYPFVASSKTFTYLANGNVAANAQVDDGTQLNVPLGFTFPFCTSSYTSVNICSNGFVSFGTNGSTTLSNYAGSGMEPGVMALHDDLGGQSGGSCTYLTTGTAPNRIFTVEYKDWKWSYQSTACITFQVKLYEAGVIECIYKSENGSPVSPSATIGIARNISDYQTLDNTSATPTSSSTVYTTSLNTKPADGQSYLWGMIPCSGIPTYEIVGPFQACPNRPFTLSIGGTAIIANLTYQWEKSLNGTTWAPYTGTGATSISMTDAITVKSYYRCVITCTNSGLSYTTKPWVVDVSPFQYCYCQNASLVTGGLDIGNVTIITQPGEDRIALNNGLSSPVFNNNTATKAYTDFQYSVPPVVIYRDSSFKISVKEITSNAGPTMVSPVNVAAYIDYDRNGVFTGNERVMRKVITASSPEPNTGIEVFTVPASASIGMTGMRVIMTTGNPDSCGTITGEGEVEDYIVDIRYEPCTSASNPGVVESSEMILCPDYDYILTDTAYERKKSELQRRWEISGDDIVWQKADTKVNTDTLMRIFKGQPLYYRVQQICPVAKDTAYTPSLLIKAKDGYKCYCYSQATGGGKDSSDIGGIMIGDYTFTTGGPHLLNPLANKKRTDHTDDAPIQMYLDSVYRIEVFQTQNASIHSDAKVTVFMDFDNDKKYETPYERVFMNYTSISNFNVADTFTVPPIAITGVPTGMRVIINNNIAPNDASDLACGPYTSGETHDFIVTFVKPFATGITKANEGISTFGMYPNPSNGKFRLQFNTAQKLDDVTVTISNITGQQVYQDTYKHNGGIFTQELDMSELVKGVYSVELRADGQRVNQKLIIK